MKRPQVIVLEADGRLAKQLAELAGEGRWLIRPVRSADAALAAARERSPAVLLVQFEPGEDKPKPLALIADVHRLAPDVPVVAIGDTKLNDAERGAWGAAVLDLGARYALFPPLAKPVLEDVVSGLMAAAVRRVVGEQAGDSAKPKRPAARREKVIDLADEDLEA